MQNRENVVKRFDEYYHNFKAHCIGDIEDHAMLKDVLELLKEQEEREKAICKEICDFIRGACSTDTDDDKDFVCYEIQRIFTRS